MSSYRGPPATYALVKEQVFERFGKVEAEAFDPSVNCFTLRHWNSLGYRIKKGERALRSFTFIEEEKENNRKTKWRKPVFLFYHTQVERVEGAHISHSDR